MVRPEDITNFAGQNWWSAFSGVGQWLGWFLAAIAILAVFWFIWNLIQYKIKVTYFPIQGDPKGKDITLGRPKSDRGRRLKINGIEHFKLLFSRKTLKDIPFNMEYPDGVYLLRKSRDEFAPISRPTMGNPSININVVDSGLQLWAQLRGQATRKRFTDEDWDKKKMLIFAGVILGCLVFAGIVIWMSYATSAAARAETGQVITALNDLAAKIGLGSP